MYLPGTRIVVQMRSLQKSFLTLKWAYIMMLLVQDGTIDLDDPVNKYLPEMATLQHNGFLDNRTITFRHLASHTSGLAVEPGLANAASGPIGEWENKVINSLPTTSVNSVPGER